MTKEADGSLYYTMKCNEHTPTYWSARRDDEQTQHCPSCGKVGKIVDAELARKSKGNL